MPLLVHWRFFVPDNFSPRLQIVVQNLRYLVPVQKSLPPGGDFGFPQSIALHLGFFPLHFPF
jgi:hypothetical protein